MALEAFLQHHRLEPYFGSVPLTAQVDVFLPSHFTQPLSQTSSLLSLFLGAAYYDDLPWPGDALMHAPEPWSGFYELGQVFWATAHITQFTSIGWRYLEHGTGVGVLDYGGTFVSLTDSHGNLTIIVETITPDNSACPHEDPSEMGVVLQNVTFQLADGFQHIHQLHVFHSAFDNSTTDFFRYLGSHPVVNGSITLLVSPNALYTLSTLNGTKGSFPEPVPARKAFPFPYADDFDGYAVSSQASYLTDQAGSFEVVPAADAEWCDRWCLNQCPRARRRHTRTRSLVTTRGRR